MPDNSEYSILLVDDEESILKNLRRLLKRQGLTKVVTALNGEQGIKLLETTQIPFFLIISDQKMPGMSGSEFLERSILLSPESRRMMITGSPELDAIIEAVNQGEIHQYIPKPWENNDFLLKISGELEMYKNFQDRKSLYNVTKNQNAKLFNLVSKQKENVAKFSMALKGKNNEAISLTQSLKEAKEQAEFKETFLGLDEILSRTITMNKNNLTDAFKLVRKEVITMMETISSRHQLPFSLKNNSASSIVAEELEDEIFEIIDQIIENVVIAVEPDLFGIGSEPNTGIVIDDYKEIPDFDELAFNDGFITKGERENALGELEQKERELSTGLTIDKILIQNDYIRRQDLSRIFSKLSMIETRLLDREFAKMLLDREIVLRKDVDRAFKKQLNNFEDSGASILLGDILVESEILEPQIRDEIIDAQDRTAKKKNAIDISSQFSSEFGAFVDLHISEDSVQAWIRIPKEVHGTTDVEPVKQLIKKRGIKYGIVDDIEIRNFLKNCTDPHEKFIVAQGIAPSVGKPAYIEYHFDTQPDSAGVVNDDGSIDFMARGDSPFVKKGQLLAEKKPMKQPKSGVDVFGEALLVGEVDDIPLEGGEGVEFSEDGLQLTAIMTGQPVMDIKGVISVLESFTVNGDVDFKTGNINFKGNVVVKGSVKEGFLVECDELIANEINGGIIKIRGDLKVSNGVVNADIQTQGSVQAKFLQKTKLYGYGNMMITREIMESYIAISGGLNNDTGRITASTIAARKGMSVKQIGTEKSEISTIKTGANDHVQWVAEKYEVQEEEKQKELDLTIAKKMELDESYNSFHVDIANQTFAQEKIIKKIDFLENQLDEIKETEKKANIIKEVKELEVTGQQCDERIKGIFQEQDIVQQEANECENKIVALNEEIKSIIQEKQKIISRLEKDDPVPELKVNKKLYTGTRITGTVANMILKQDFGASKFSEIDSEDPESPKKITHQTLNL
jgi:uncharacterized protein (DUF342 family)/YesN/AraC family two-component response regulator